MDIEKWQTKQSSDRRRVIEIARLRPEHRAGYQRLNCLARLAFRHTGIHHKFNAPSQYFGELQHR